MNAVNELKVIISAEVDKLNKALGFTKKKVEETKESIEGTNKTINKSVKKSSRQIGNYTSRLIKRFFLISLALRPIVKALETFNKLVSNGLSNVYKYSSVIGGNFAKNIDNLRDSLNYYGNSIAAILVPTLNAMIPVLSKIIDKLADFNNMIAEMNAYLHNQSSYLKAVKKEGVETFNVLLQNYQKLKRTVSGFDELNIINTNSDVMDMFTIEEVEIEKPLDGFLDKIKEVGLAIKDLLFAPFRKIGEEIEKIWNKVKPIFDNMGDRLNKIFSPDFGSLGDRLKEIFNPITNGINSPFFGLDIALDSETFKAIVDTIPTALGIWVQLGTTFKNILTKVGEIVRGILDAIGKPIDNAIANILNSISNWYENSGGKDAIENLGKSLLGFLDRIATLFKGIEPLLRSIGTLVGNLIKAAPTMEVLDGIIKAITYITQALAGLFDICTGLSTFNYEKVGRGIETFFTSIASTVVQIFETIFNVFVNFINGIIFGVRDGINSMIKGLNDLSGKVFGSSWNIKELDWKGIPTKFNTPSTDSSSTSPSASSGNDNSLDLSFIGSALEGSIKMLQESGYLNSPPDMGAVNNSQQLVLEVDGQVLGKTTLSNINRLTKQSGYTQLNLAF